ncbi:MAG: ABC transporter permease [Saprospiraceae bacterium]|jgi:putative ABC transport system permease protein|nr:ABC transporter permease [Saprospiraceae bacterium]
MISNYIKIAWRNIIINPLYSVINISGLALGLAICMLITLFVKDELSFDQFFTKKREIYRLVVEERSPEGEVRKFGQTGLIHGPSFQIQASAITNMVRYQQQHYAIKTDDDIVVQSAFLVDSTYFNMFDATFVDGNKHKALYDPQSIVITKKLAEKYFNTISAVGKSLNINFDEEFQNFTVSGVIENPPVNSSMQAEMLIPIHKSKNRDNQWINFYINTFFEIPEGTDIANVEKQFALIFATDAKDQIADAAKEWNYKDQLTFKLQPFLDIHLSKDFKAVNGMKESGNILFSYFLSGIALFILLIACINFINLAIARSVERSKEVGVRKAIGSTRKQLICQFLSESFLLNGFAFILGIILTYTALPVFNQLSDKQLDFSYLFDAKLLTIFIAIFLLTGLLAGFYPALLLSGFNPVETLYGRINLGGKNLLQKSLIVFQFSLASFFIIFAIVQYRQANLFVTKDLGYDDQNLIEIEADGMTLSKIGVVENELKKDPSVLNVSPINPCCWMTGVSTKDGKEMSPYMKVTNYNLINTMGLTMKEGRFFSPDFPGDSTQSAIVNESFVKAGNMKDPIGQTIKVMNRDNYQIVGVVRDYHHTSLYQTVQPQVFISNPQQGWGAFLIRISDKNIPKTLDHIKDVIKSQFPTRPYKYDFVSDVNAKQYEKEFRMRQMILYSALIIIFISGIGMFGLSALTAQKRTKEIGIRKILGASIASIVNMISIQFFKLVLIAFFIAAPIAYLVIDKVLQNLPYRVPVSVDIFVYTLLGIIFLSIITTSYQALKTAMMDPVKSLKSE